MISTIFGITSITIHSFNQPFFRVILIKAIVTWVWKFKFNIKGSHGIYTHSSKRNKVAKFRRKKMNLLYPKKKLPYKVIEAKHYAKIDLYRIFLAFHP